MFTNIYVVEDGLCRELESLSVSRKLVRSVSHTLRKKRTHRSAGDEEEIASGFSLRCLALYGRGGGCKVGVDISEELGHSSTRRRSSASEEGKGYKPMCGAEETGIDCFSYGKKDRFWKRNNRTEFGIVIALGNHVLDVALKQWHNINADVLRGRFMYSVASIRDEIFIVGGCSSLTSFGRVDRSSFKTHKSMLVFTPSTKSWRNVASMKYARSSPVLGICEVSLDCPIIQSQSSHQDRRFPRSRLGGVSDFYEDPHRLSVRRQLRSLSEENAGFLAPIKKQCRPLRQRSDTSSLRDCKRFVLIAIGGLGSWDEPVDLGELYDSMSNKWIEIQKLPVDFGIVCSGVICNTTFFVYSESDKLAGYDIERGYWNVIQTTPCPPRVHEYYPKLVSCNSRLFMLSVSWCEGDGQIGRRNKAIRKMWELDLMYLAWTEVSIHPDAPMNWNAAFVADKNLIFGVEMFKTFGQVLDFFTVCDVSDKVMKWSHISRNRVAHELDASSCTTKIIVLFICDLCSAS